jgi:hypothetical protein
MLYGQYCMSLHLDDSYFSYEYDTTKIKDKYDELGEK